MCTHVMFNELTVGLRYADLLNYAEMLGERQKLKTCSATYNFQHPEKRNETVFFPIKRHYFA